MSLMEALKHKKLGNMCYPVSVTKGELASFTVEVMKCTTDPATIVL